MDGPTITLLMGIISCVIGISTFISGRMTKAEKNGSIETKIEQALEGISSINKKLEVYVHDQHATELLVRTHEEQIKTLFKQDEALQSMLLSSNQTYDALKEILVCIKGGMTDEQRAH